MMAGTKKSINEICHDLSPYRLSLDNPRTHVTATSHEPSMFSKGVDARSFV